MSDDGEGVRLDEFHEQRVFKMRKLHRDFAHTFKTPEGSAVLDHLRSYCRFDQPVFVPGDPHATAYQDGCRRVFLHIQAMMNLSEEDIVRLTHDQSSEIDEETGV